MSKHTPGPWTLLVSEEYRGNYEITEALSEEHDANARLIAAAPDLLAALIRVRDEAIDDSPEMWSQVSAAIAKAESPRPVAAGVPGGETSRAGAAESEAT